MTKPIYLHPETVRLEAALTGHPFVNWLEKLSNQVYDLKDKPGQQKLMWLNVRTLVTGALQDSFLRGVKFRVWVDEQRASGRHQVHKTEGIRAIPECMLTFADDQDFYARMVSIDLLAIESLSRAGDKHTSFAS